MHTYLPTYNKNQINLLGTYLPTRCLQNIIHFFNADMIFGISYKYINKYETSTNIHIINNAKALFLDKYIKTQ